MKRILADVNVILDVLLDRKPNAEVSAAVWAAVETGTVEGLLSAHAVTTIHYLIRKEKGTASAKGILSAILSVFGVAPVDNAVIREALQLSCSDFEDAVTAAAARLAHCDAIVSRDIKGFRGSQVPCLTPEAILPLLRTTFPPQ
jgi:predicted nucleic acid-binding protein